MTFHAECANEISTHKRPEPTTPDRDDDTDAPVVPPDHPNVPPSREQPVPVREPGPGRVPRRV